MSPKPHGWLPPRLASRTGAAHQRRGSACQDACGWLVCRDRDGQAVQLLVVSDGHGGARYHRSDAGSRLACRVALQEAARSLAAASTADPAAAGSGAANWADWLARELPARIVAAWRQAVLKHHRSQQEEAAAPGEGGDPLLAYGATLGLLVLSRCWWGHSGLGDWDLVRVDGPRGQEAGGGAALISEEAAIEGGGEATYSLCMGNAEQRFAPRSGLHRLDQAEAPFQLLLCTDGIRKSCSSDGDFLTLAGHLMALPAAVGPGDDPALAEALDHISREGSGDDVSAVIGSWGTPEGGTDGSRKSDAAWMVGEAADGPLILQPPPPEKPGAQGFSAGLRPERLAGNGLAAPQLEDLAGALPGGWADPARGVASDARQAHRQREPGEETTTAAGSSRARGGEAPVVRSAGDRSPGAGPWHRRLPAVLAVLALMGSGGTLLAWWLKAGPFAAAPQPPLLTAQQHAAIRRQVEELCGVAGAPQERQASGRDERIRAALQQRISTFQELAAMTTTELEERKADLLQRDPRTALITLSRLAPPADLSAWRPDPGTAKATNGAGTVARSTAPAGLHTKRPAARAGVPDQWSSTAAPAATAAASDAMAGQPICAELQRELAAQWTRLRPVASSQPQKGPPLGR